MNTREDALAYGLSFADTYKDAPFRDPNWQLVRYKPNKKAFLWTYEKDGYVNLNVKVKPENAFFWRDVYESVIPGYHQNKDHWNTIILDGTIPDDDIRLMIAESYDLVSDSPTKRIYEAVKKIPYGRVATYSQIAEMAGDKKMARAVGNALHKNPDPDGIPCFRVVNAKGELAGEFAFGGIGKQAKLLEVEGIEVVDGKVDLKKYKMKKAIAAMLAFGVMVGALTGCGSNTDKLEAEADEIMSAIKTNDTAYLSKLFESVPRDLEGVEDGAYQSVVEDADAQEYAQFFGDNLTYTISDVNEDDGTVSVDVTYIDGDYLMGLAFSAALNNGGNMGLANLIDKIDTSKVRNDTVVLDFDESDGEYTLKELPDMLWNLMDLGLYARVYS